MTGNGSSEEDRRPETFLGLTKFQFTLATLIVAIVCVFVSLATFAYAVSANADRISDGARRDAEIERVAIVAANAAKRLDTFVQENRITLCAQKENAQRQVESTADYLATHTGPEPIPGISRNDLIKTLERQRDFRDTFAQSDCEGVDAP